MSDRGDHEHPLERLRSARFLVRMPWVVPILLVVVGVVLNLLDRRGETFAATFAAAPLAAAALWSVRGTLLVSLLSVGAMGAVAGAQDNGAYAVVVRLTTVALVAVLSVAMSHARRHIDIKLASTRQIAEAAQLAVLPTPPARVGNLSVAVRYRPAHAGARIGGDLYAVQRTPYGVRVLVGDVCGKGLRAVDTVTVVLGAFREGAEREADLAAVAAWIEHALGRESELAAGPERMSAFVTAVLAEAPRDRPGVLRVVNRGHPPPLLLPGDGSVRPLEASPPALPLGLGDLDPGARITVQQTAFPAGAMLLMYTDGVSEARNADGQFYDPVAGLTGRRFGGPVELLDTLVRDTERHTAGGADDDMALLALRRRA